MLSVADASRAVLERITPLVGESVALGAANGRVLAQDIAAPRKLPAFDNSAMDGYAVRAVDVPGTLPVAGVVAAGDRGTELRPGTALRIFTGAPMPPGADTVVIQEDAIREGERVTLPESFPGDNVRRAGEDITAGVLLYRKGHRLRAWDLAVLASIGVAKVDVAMRPRIALLATGDELVDIDATPGHGQLVASTRYALASLVESCGAMAIDLGIVADDETAIATAIKSGLRYDALITTGGVSVGDRDFVRAALGACGVIPELWKVAIKPGKPFSFGRSQMKPVFGLPGNPVSSLVSFELFVRPAILAMQGCTATERMRVRAVFGEAYRKQPGRAHYVRARVAREGDVLVAHPHAKQGSAMLSALVTSNALVELPADRGDIASGEIVDCIVLDNYT